MFSRKIKNNISNICVFCGSRFGTKTYQNDYITAAEAVGKFLAKNNINLVFGSGNTGLMGVVSDTCLDNGGKVYGFTTKELIKVETPRKHKNHKIKILKNLQERKLAMINKADAFIILPGGFGTFDEILEVIVAKQIKEIDKPIFIINIKDFYTDFYKFVFKDVIKNGFANIDAINLITAIGNTKSILNKVSAYNK